MHRIALIRFVDTYAEYDSYDKIITSITDWKEVDDETFNLLKNEQYRYGWRMIEHVPSEEVEKTVDEILERIRKDREAAEARKAANAAKALEKKLKRQANDRQKKLAMLARLKEELGET